MKNDPTILLNPLEKVKYLLLFEMDLQNTFEKLEEIQNFKKYIEFSPILDVNKKLESLMPVDIENEEIISQFTDQNQHLKTFLELNNVHVNTINNRFL